MVDRVDAWYQLAVRRPETPPWARRALVTTAIVARELTRDQVHVRAATLAYWSLVAVVPMLLLVAAVVEGLGAESAGPVRALIYNTLLAGSVRDVGTTLDGWLAEVDMRSLGLAGLAGVGFTASRIYFSVEEAYNHLWNVRVKRGIVLRLAIFYATVTIAPLLLALGFHYTAELDEAGSQWRRHAVPVLLTALAFVGAIRTLPDTHVRWTPAIFGGLVSAILFEIAKVGFAAYTDVLGAGDAAAAIYGSLGFFPIFLIWLYTLWIIVLVGVELAYVTQRHGDLLEAEERLLQGEQHARRHADALFGLQCLLVVARNWVRGGGPTPEAGVTRELHSEPTFVRAALETLEDAGILAESPAGYLPALPPDRVSVREVILRYRAATRPGLVEGAVGSDLVAEILGAPNARLDETVASLVAR
ncbi:MAG: YihY/virulence factor BrkB family protein [Myxococcota bacterium]